MANKAERIAAEIERLQSASDEEIATLAETASGATRQAAKTIEAKRRGPSSLESSDYRYARAAKAFDEPRGPESDRVIYWCDFAQEKGEDRVGVCVTGSDGKITAQHLYAVSGMPADDFQARECYAVLIAVKLAVKNGESEIRLCSDRVGSWKIAGDRHYVGQEYLDRARIAAETGSLSVEFDRVEGRKNLANRTSRATVLPLEQVP